MSYVALALALVAVFFALRKRPEAAADPKALEDLRQEARRRVDNLAEELRQELAMQRRLLGELAAGTPLTREQVEEGRLWKDVSNQEGEALLQSGRVHVLDVRTPRETSEGILPGAILIPVDQLEARLGELPKDDRPTLVYCAAGGRSAAACEFLESQGRRSLLNLSGGFSGWRGPRAKAE